MHKTWKNKIKFWVWKYMICCYMRDTHLKMEQYTAANWKIESKKSFTLLNWYWIDFYTAKFQREYTSFLHEGASFIIRDT